MNEGKKFILLVDDDKLFIESCKRIFRKIDLVLIPTSSPEKAIFLMEEMEFYAVISDQNMPGIIGTTLLMEAKKLQPKALRILITGEPNLQTMIDAVNKSEIDRVFTKPFSAKELIDYIQQEGR